MQSATFELTNKIYKAGAGAGKTTKLVQEVYDFYCHYKESNKLDPKIVLTTFTRKATQELRERLMLFGTLNDNEEFLNFVLSKNKLTITTMHGLMQTFLKQHIQLLEFDPAFKIADKRALKHKEKKILKDIINEDNSFSELLEEFSFKDLLKHVSSISDTKLLIAEGKKNKVSYPTIDDFHKLKKDFVKEVVAEADVIADSILTESSDPKWIEFANSLKLLCKEAIKNLDINLFSVKFLDLKKPTYSKKSNPVSDHTNEEFKSIKKKISDIDFELFDESLWEDDQVVYKMLNSISDKFLDKLYQYKKENGLISLSDIESLTIKVLNEFPENCFSFSNSFNYWLIDEYQDTSPIQVEILNKLIAGKPRFIVGDPQQSIYYFRGSREEVFKEGIETVKGLDGNYDELNKNYRTSMPLMSFINDFFVKYRRKFKDMEIGSKDKSTKKDVVNFFLNQSEDEQLETISNYILNIYESEKTKKVFGDIAIIVRKNDQLQRISEALKKKNIPYVVHAASGFHNRREIMDALSILKFLLVPYDNKNLISILRSPWFKVEDKDIITLVKNEKGNIWSTISESLLNGLCTEKYASIYKLNSYLLMTYEIGVTSVFEKILFDRGFFDTSYKLDPSGKREANLWKLITDLKEQDHKPGFSYLKYVEGYSSTIDTEVEESDAISSLEPNRVNLMTVHLSKGLEFKHVLIPYFNKKPQISAYKTFLFDEVNNKWVVNLKGRRDSASNNLYSNYILKKNKINEESENDRLLYVALTRAKNTLGIFTTGKSESKSWLEGVGIDLTLGTHEKDKYNYGVHEFCKSSDLEAPDLTADFKVKPIFSETNECEELNSVSATDSVKKQKQIFLPSMDAAEYGTLLHKVFESMKYGTHELLFDNKKIKEDVDQCLNFLSETKVPFKEILDSGFAEWGFILNTKEKQITGQIDLWANLNGNIWIIDYKTGSSKYKESAIEQLRVYSEAIKAHVKEYKSISLVALYPLEGKYFIENES